MFILNEIYTLFNQFRIELILIELLISKEYLQL